MPRHHTKDKGDLATAKVHADLTARGLMVLLPLTEHAPFDLVAYDGSLFTRIQVKYRTAVRGVVSVHLRSVWSDRNGVHARPLNRAETDLIAVYNPESDRCYYIDPSRHVAHVSFRLDPPRNGQRTGVIMADELLDLPLRTTDSH